MFFWSTQDALHDLRASVIESGPSQLVPYFATIWATKGSLTGSILPQILLPNVIKLAFGTGHAIPLIHRWSSPGLIIMQANPPRIKEPWNDQRSEWKYVAAS